MINETVYSILKKVDRKATLTNCVSSVMVYLSTNSADIHSNKECIEFRKIPGAVCWVDSVKKTIADNKPLNNVFKTCPVLDTNMMAIELRLTSTLQIIVNPSPDTEIDKEENTNMDNQQLSKDNDAIESCNMALTVEDLKTFLSIIQSDTKIFATDGKRIFPITSLSILKRDEGEDDMIAVFGELNRNLVFESSTTRDNPVDVK